MHLCFQVYPSTRPFTAYASFANGEPQTKKWMCPPRPTQSAGATPYKASSPRQRPKNAHVFQGTGSALDLQMVRIDAAAKTPYAKMFGKPSTAISGCEAFEEVQAKYGPFRSIDSSWSWMDSSSYWNAENRPRKGDKLQRQHGIMLKAMRPATAPHEARKEVAPQREMTAEDSWLPPVHGESRFKRPSTVNHQMMPTSTVWWYDTLQTLRPEDDGEWVTSTERPRHASADAEKLKAQKERLRTDALMKILGEDDEDHASEMESPSRTPSTYTGEASRSSSVHSVNKLYEHKTAYAGVDPNGGGLSRMSSMRSKKHASDGSSSASGYLPPIPSAAR
jgi:hypothetical protein